MKPILLSLCLFFAANISAQSCQELIDYVEENSIGTTYQAHNSSAISKVTFYEVTEDFETYYFALVCFKKSEWGFSCEEYLYQVGRYTESHYSSASHSSAGKAFWKYIHPHNKNLNCAPDFN